MRVDVWRVGVLRDSGAGANGCAWHPETLSQALLPNNWGTLNPSLREFPSAAVGLTLIHNDRDFVNDRFVVVGLWPWHCRHRCTFFWLSELAWLRSRR